MKNLPTQSRLAYQRIRQTIISGELKSGDIVNIDELCKKFSIGKTPTREALVVLTHEKLLEPLPRIGYLVTEPSIQDVLEMFHVRTILEVEAIGLAAELISSDDLKILEKNIKDELKASKKGNGNTLHAEMVRLNQEFHMTIAHACGNKILASLIQQQLDMVELALSFDPYLADPSQHADILSALKKRDKALCQEAMRTHLQSTRTRIMTHY